MTQAKPRDLWDLRQVVAKKKTKQGRAMAPPDRAVTGYTARLRDLNNAWAAHIMAELAGPLRELEEGQRSDAVGGSMADAIQRLRDGMAVFLDTSGVGLILAGQINRVSSFNMNALGRSLGIDLSSSASVSGLGGLIPAFRAKNVDLIESLLSTQLAEVTTILEAGEGVRVEVLTQQIKKRFAVGQSRAALIARDQTLKLNANITKQRQQDVGVTRYKWVTSMDERVRADHLDLDGGVFEWANPPVVDKKTERVGHPGEDYQCRCTATPIFDNL